MRSRTPRLEGFLELVRPLLHETLHEDSGGSFRVGAAQTFWQREQAHQLVVRQYRAAGLVAPTAPAHGGTSSATLVAMRGLSTIGTMNLRFDSPAGLLADERYGETLDALRKRDAVLCEFGRFASDSKLGTIDLMGTLLRCAWKIGCEGRGATDVVVECHPRHAAFYRRTLGFRIAGAETVCARVGAPAVLLHLPVQSLKPGALDAYAPRVADLRRRMLADVASKKPVPTRAA